MLADASLLPAESPVHVPCECGNRFELTDSDRDRLAGKFVSCPACGVSKRLPAASGFVGSMGSSSGMDRSTTIICETSTAAVPPKLTPRRSPALILGAIAAAVLLLLIFAGLGVRSWATSAPGGPVAKVVLSPLERAQAAVRDHLRGSLPSGEFEEIEWFDMGPANGCRVWPNGRMDAISQAHFRGQRDSYRDVDADGRCVRLRFRSAMPIVGSVVQDWSMLTTESGDVVHAVPSEDLLLPDETPQQMSARLETSPEAGGQVRRFDQSRQNQAAMNGILDAVAGQKQADDEP